MTNLLAARGQVYIRNELPVWSFASRHQCFTAGWWAQWRICYLFTCLHTYLLTYVITYFIEQNPTWEANRFSASQKIPRNLWNPEVHYRIYKCPPPVPILSHINSVHAPHPTTWRAILILSSQLRLGHPSGLFPSGFPTKTLYAPLLPHTCYMPRLSHSSRFEHPNNIGWGVQITSSLCNFLHSHVTSVLLGPNILLNTIFSNTLSLRSSLSVSDQVSHPHKTGKL